VSYQRDLGVDLVLVHMNWATLDDLCHGLSSFANQVMPRFR
jgi:hypothetical protein